jgi:tRNA threonylcarbamoyl adenosine modification protein (Sua5/YciO/YrdC/YwlC family)
MLLHLHPANPQPRNLKIVTECLLDGGVIIYPTDTIYGLGCDIFQHKAIERICRIKHIEPARAQLSFICYDLSDLSQYTKSISTPLYRLLKTHLPGPYTFILPASRQVPRILKSRKQTIGLRIPDNIIARALVKELQHPILSSSLPGVVFEADGSSAGAPVALPVEEYTDPEMINEKFGNLVDIVIDGGIGGTLPSTVIDCTGDEPVLVRRGLGEVP